MTIDTLACAKELEAAGVQRQAAEALSHYLLAAPPAPVAECFGALARPIFARAAVAATESRALAAIRDALLPKLISGEIRVKNAERIVAEAAG
jgi:type I restriction enzyme S subunit